MSYTDPEGKLKSLRRSEWLKFSDFRDWVSLCSTLSFNVAANRTLIRNEFRGIPRVMNILVGRFPEDYHVKMQSTPIATQVRTLLSTMDLPDRAINREHQPYDTNDSKRAYDVAWTHILESISLESDAELAARGIMDRASFERKYNLNWSSGSGGAAK